jgi:hypothetical protein
MTKDEANLTGVPVSFTISGWRLIQGLLTDEALRRDKKPAGYVHASTLRALRGIIEAELQQVED